MTGLLIFVGLTALAFIAPRYGVDLRDGRDWRSQGDQGLAGSGARHTPRSDLAKLSRWASWVGSVLGRRWEAQERAWGASWQTYQPWRGDEQPPRLDKAPVRIRPDGGPGSTPGDSVGSSSGDSERGAGERGRHRGELRWRKHGRSWRLEGQLLPAGPSTGGPSGGRPAHHD
jgi:hypothetical protein